MKKRIWLISGLMLVAVAALLLFLLMSLGKQENSATIVQALNRVDAHPRPGDAWRPAVAGMTIYGGGQVRTGAASSARLQLVEGVVRLAADSIFTLRESTSRRGRVATTVALLKGRLWAHVTTDRPHEFAVETGNAVAAVRDTRFSVRVADGQTFLSVAEGEVELTAQEQRVTVSAGQQTTVEQDQPPAPPEPMSDEERALWAVEGDMPSMAPATQPPTPTPTMDADPSVYDNFDNPANEGSYDEGRWILAAKDNQVAQRDGVMTFSQHRDPRAGAELTARAYHQIVLDQPIFFEADVMLSQEAYVGNVHLDLRTKLGPRLYWYAQCVIDYVEEKAWGNCFNEYVRDGRSDTTYGSESVRVALGSWHTLRMEADPSTMTFRYYLDGQLLGSHTPSEADRLKTALFNLSIGTYAPRPDPLIGHLDNVRIGPLESVRPIPTETSTVVPTATRSPP
jgi:hypothetical protein